MFPITALVFAMLRAAGLLFGALALGWSLALLLAVLVFECWVFLTLAAAVVLAREHDARGAWSPGTIARLAVQVLGAAVVFGLLLGAMAALMADIAFPGGEAWDELRKAWSAEHGSLVLAIVVALELLDAIHGWRDAATHPGGRIERSMPLAFWRVVLTLAVVVGVAELAPIRDDGRILVAIGVTLVIVFVDGLPAQATRLLRLRQN